MDIFKVHGQLIDDYKSFTTSSVTPLDHRIAQYVQDELAEGKQWPAPWLSLNPTFASGGSIDVKQLPILSPRTASQSTAWTGVASFGEWAAKRVKALQHSWKGERATVRAELDAAFFRLYGIERHDVDYIMETFPIVKRKDVAEHGECRTKRMILEIYDAMAEAEATGIPYASPFDATERT